MLLKNGKLFNQVAVWKSALISRRYSVMNIAMDSEESYSACLETYFRVYVPVQTFPRF